MIRFNTIIVRKTSLAANYPGGLDAYRSAYLPNGASFYYEDRHLVAHVSISGFYDVEERLALNGLVRQGGGASADASADDYCGANQADGVEAGCPWLSTREIGALPACWLVPEAPGHVVDYKGRRFVQRVSEGACHVCGRLFGLAVAAMAVDAREWRDGPLAFVDPNGRSSAGGYIVVCAGCGGERAFDERGQDIRVTKE